MSRHRLLRHELPQSRIATATSAEYGSTKSDFFESVMVKKDHAHKRPSVLACRS
jgi:hypothetical protein